jgi:hypothetical protein
MAQVVPVFLEIRFYRAANAHARSMDTASINTATINTATIQRASVS